MKEYLKELLTILASLAVIFGAAYAFAQWTYNRTTNIQANTKAITTNTQAIKANTLAIEELQENVETLQGNVETLRGDVQKLNNGMEERFDKLESLLERQHPVQMGSREEVESARTMEEGAIVSADAVQPQPTDSGNF